jgi:trehalose-phosphatase
LPVEIHHGKKIVEVCSIQINKGSVLEHFMLLNNYDPVLCAGDDETDESMFRYAGDAEMFSIKVGDGADTMDRFRITGPKAFSAFFREMMENM